MKTSQWFVGSKDIESVYKACEAMKCNPVECDSVGKDLVVAFLKSRGRWDDESCAIKRLPKIRLDLGGMVKVDEPSVSWQANGVKFSAMLHQLEDLACMFENAHVSKTAAPGCLKIGGFCRLYLLSEKTVKACLKALPKLVKKYEEKAASLKEEKRAVLLRANKGLEAVRLPNGNFAIVDHASPSTN